MKNILIIQGHPNKKSLCGALAESYQKAAEGKGSQVQLIHIADLNFDPILRFGFKDNQKLEPDLLEMQKKITWAEHIVWVYPNWWGAAPALLKGFIDRILLPGFAFQYKKEPGFPEKLLKGRTTEIILTLDTPPILYKWILGAPGLKAMKSGVLEFCGLKVVHTQFVGPVRGSSDEQRKKWIEQVQQLIK